MKKLLYLAGMLTLLTNISCDDDATEEPAITGPITFDGEAFTAEQGFVQDFGADDTHYNFDFHLVDENLQFTDIETNQIFATFYFYAELFSPGTADFKNGTFTFNPTPAEGDFYFTDIDLVVDNNDDNKVNSSDTWYNATSGTVTVTGSPHNYTLSFDIVVDDGKNLVGSYTGNFEYRDER